MTSVTAAPIRVRMSKILVAPLVYATASAPEITSAAPINVSCPNFMPSPPYPARKPCSLPSPLIERPVGRPDHPPGHPGEMLSCRAPRRLAGICVLLTRHDHGSGVDVGAGVAGAGVPSCGICPAGGDGCGAGLA